MKADVNIRQDFRPTPRDPDELLRQVAGIIEAYEGRLVSIVIRAKNPLIFEYVGDDNDVGPGPEITPYSVLQHGRIDEYESDSEPLGVLAEIMHELVSAKVRPVCIITNSDDIWSWIGMNELRHRRAGHILGYPVIYDTGIPESTLIVAGAPDASVGYAGVTYGLKYGW